MRVWKRRQNMPSDCRPLRHAAGDQRDEPVADGNEVERDLQGVERRQARQREQPGRRREAVLTHRRVDLDIDGIAAAGAERRKRVGQDRGRTPSTRAE